MSMEQWPDDIDWAKSIYILRVKHVAVSVCHQIFHIRDDRPVTRSLSHGCPDSFTPKIYGIDTISVISINIDPRYRIYSLIYWYIDILIYKEIEAADRPSTHKAQRGMFFLALTQTRRSVDLWKVAEKEFVHIDILRVESLILAQKKGYLFRG